MADVFNTANGPRSVGQMQIELQNAGWQGGEDVASAYARTTGGAVTAGNSGTTNTSTNANAPSDQQGVNLDAARLAAQLADNAAQVAYNNAKLNLDSEDLAFRKAQQAWTETYQRASLTGTLDGQQTLAAQQQQASITGYYNGAPTFAREQEQNRVAQAYLQLQAGLRGPNDPLQYLRTLSGTPAGMTDIVNAAWGRYMLGGNPSGEQSAAATIGGQIGNLNAATGYSPGAGAAPGGSATPGAAPYSSDQLAAIDTYMNAQIGQNNWAGGVFHQLVNQGVPIVDAIRKAAQGMGGVPLDPSRYTLPQIPQAAAVAATPVAATAPGATTAPPGTSYDAFIASLPKLPGAGQIDPTNFNAMDPSQKAALWAAYEAGLGPTGAMRPEDAQAAYLRSLPRYSYSGTGTVKV